MFGYCRGGPQGQRLKVVARALTGAVGIVVIDRFFFLVSSAPLLAAPLLAAPLLVSSGQLPGCRRLRGALVSAASAFAAACASVNDTVNDVSSTGSTS